MFGRFVRRFIGRRRSRGQSMVEFALVLPLFLFVLAMTADFGRLFYSYVAVANGAKEGAMYGSRNPICATNADPTTCPDPNNVTYRVQNEASNISGIAVPLVECLAPDGTVRSQLTQCAPNDTYVVQASYQFTFLTPILSSVLGNGLTLRAQSEATVLNTAFDPTPGASITKYACFGTNCTPAVTPLLDSNNNPTYVAGQAGDTITYQITVKNIGGSFLTGVSVTDTNLNLPFGSATCPSLPSTMSVNTVWQCTYTKTAPNTNGQPTLLYTNTATFTANEIQPRQAVATVQIDAAAGGLSVAKYVSPYKLGGSGSGPFGTAGTMDVGVNTAIPTATVWYEIVVSNPGTATTLGITVDDSNGTLPVTTDCPAAPTSLAAGASWTCKYSKQWSLAGSYTNTVTADASNLLPAGARTATATVNVSGCALPNLVIPKLIGLDRNGAQSAWSAAGFSPSNLTTWGGAPSATVASQNVQAYSCVPASTTMTVSR